MGALWMYGSTFLEQIFLFRSMVTTQHTAEAQKWDQGAGKNNRGRLRPPKELQNPLTHFQNGPEEQTAHANSFTWRGRNLIPGQGKITYKKVPPQSLGGISRTPCHLYWCWTQDWWSPFLSFWSPFNFSIFSPLYFYSIIISIIIIIMEKNIYQFPCRVHSLLVKLCESFFGPFWLLPFFFLTTGIHKPWVLLPCRGGTQRNAMFFCRSYKSLYSL